MACCLSTARRTHSWRRLRKVYGGTWKWLNRLFGYPGVFRPNLDGLLKTVMKWQQSWPSRIVRRSQKNHYSVPRQRSGVEAWLVGFTNRINQWSPDMEQIQALAPDLLITAAFGQFLPSALLEVPKYARYQRSCVPTAEIPWRGSCALCHHGRWARNGCVTIMEMIKKMDAGGIFAQARFAITAQDDVGRCLISEPIRQRFAAGNCAENLVRRAAAGSARRSKSHLLAEYQPWTRSHRLAENGGANRRPSPRHAAMANRFYDTKRQPLEALASNTVGANDDSRQERSLNGRKKRCWSLVVKARYWLSMNCSQLEKADKTLPHS